MTRVRVGLAALAAFAGLATAPASATTYTAQYAFGDSLSDVGNVYNLTGGLQPVSPPYAQHYSNGPLWVQDLSQALGLAPLTASRLGGTDFAYAGAQTGTTGVHPANQLDLGSQLQQFQTQVPTPVSGALYTLWIGSNDLFTILGANATPQQAQTYAVQALDNEISFLTSLIQDGARNLLVLDVPDLGKTPRITALGAAASTAASLLAQAYDQNLAQALGALRGQTGANITLLDTYGLIDGAVANPAAFGFTDVSHPCWTGTDTNPNSGTVCATPSTYLFWDGVHPTATGHAEVAAAALAAVPEPSGVVPAAAALAGLFVLRRRRTA